jgi:hypothetical protein
MVISRCDIGTLNIAGLQLLLDVKRRFLHLVKTWFDCADCGFGSSVNCALALCQPA